MKKNLSVVIPCFNERENLPLIFERLLESCGHRSDELEVILVDNGSADGSLEVMHTLVDQHAMKDWLRVHRVEQNLGYGFGILAGLAQARGQWLGWTHADMQTDPYDALRAFDELVTWQGAEAVVKGKRRGRNPLDALFTFGMQLFAWTVLKVKLDDINGQPKVFSRAFYEQHLRANAPHDFSLDLFLLHQALVNGVQILEVPVYFAPRRHGEAKGGGSLRTRIRLIQRTFGYIMRLRQELFIPKEGPAR